MGWQQRSRESNGQPHSQAAKGFHQTHAAPGCSAAVRSSCLRSLRRRVLTTWRFNTPGGPPELSPLRVQHPSFGSPVQRNFRLTGKYKKRYCGSRALRATHDNPVSQTINILCMAGGQENEQPPCDQPEPFLSLSGQPSPAWCRL